MTHNNISDEVAVSRIQEVFLDAAASWVYTESACGESNMIPRCLQRYKLDAPLLAGGDLIDDRERIMYQDIVQDALQKTMIAAHRGVAGGNIPGNTPDAFDAALAQGADLVELDVAASGDGGLFVFHPGMEYAYLNSERLIQHMTEKEVAGLRFVNGDRTPTDQKVCTLDEVLEHLKGRCYINIDKFWDNVEPITETVRRHGMERQILVKTAPDEAVFRKMECVAPDIAYMLILQDEDKWTERMSRWNIYYVGVEALFETEDSELASEEYVRKMHNQGKLVWVNAIVYDYHAVLSAGHNDDISVVGRMDEGWGWLLKKGYDIIQTDWPLMLRQYMEKGIIPSGK